MQECPLCGYKYAAEKVAVLEEYAGSHLVHITCPQCHNAVLAMVMVSALGMSSVGIVTDLSSADVLRVRRREPIGEDELLSFHQCLHRRYVFENLIVNQS